MKAWLFELEVAASSLGFSALLPTMGFRRSARIAAALGSIPGGSMPPPSTAMGRLARHVRPRPSCLARSLALWTARRRRGGDPELKLGAQAGPAVALDAHAWLEQGGQAIGDLGSERYEPFAPGCMVEHALRVR